MKRLTIREFLFGNYKKGATFTDCSFMDYYITDNYKAIPVHAIGKKCESIRKQLWEFKRAGIIQEVRRETKGWSDEITYKLLKNDKVKESILSRLGSKLKIFTVGK